MLPNSVRPGSLPASGRRHAERISEYSGCPSLDHGRSQGGVSQAKCLIQVPGPFVLPMKLGNNYMH